MLPIRTAISLLLLLLLALPASGQPLLTATNTTPEIGDRYIYNLFNAEVVPVGNPGTNQTWSFSSLVPTGKDSVQILAPSNTPNPSPFPTASIVEQRGNDFHYYEVSSDSISLVGSDNIGFQTSVYDNPRTWLKFPLTYGDSIADHWTSLGLVGAPSPRTGNVVGYADGWGSLTTPEGVYPNVLRIKYNEHFEDSSGNGFLRSVDQEEYHWYVPGTALPVLYRRETIVQTIGGTIDTLYRAGFMEGTSVAAVSPLSSVQSLTVLPNPAGDVANIRFNIREAEEIDISVTSMTGIEVLNLPPSRFGPGPAEVQLDLHCIPPGFYLIRLHGVQGGSCSPLIVR